MCVSRSGANCNDPANDWTAWRRVLSRFQARYVEFHLVFTSVSIAYCLSIPTCFCALFNRVDCLGLVLKNNIKLLTRVLNLEMDPNATYVLHNSDVIHWATDGL